MKKYFLFAILWLITAIPVTAQTGHTKIITGNIVDEKKLPVPYATAILKTQRDSSVYKTVLCNDKGSFTYNLLKAGGYFLEVSVVGYNKLVKENILLAENDTLINLGVLILQTSGKMLSGVIVKAAAPLIERKIDRTVVNISNSITSEGSTVLEVMKKLPGVQVTAEGQISLNGKSGVNVYIDGKSTYLSVDDLANLLNGMSASSIQKIEIMTNPPAKYDAAGTGGIINIIKKKSQKEGLNGSINAGLGQSHYSIYNTGVSLSYKSKNFNLYFNNTYSYNKNLFRRTVTSDILNVSNGLMSEQVSVNNVISNGRGYRPTLDIDFYLSKKTTLSLSGTAGTGVSNNLVTSSMDILDGNLSKTNYLNFGSTLKNKPFNYTTGMQLSHQLDTLGNTINIDLDYSDYESKPVQQNLSTLYDSNGSFISKTDALLWQQRQINIYAIKATYTKQLKNKGQFEAGLKSSYVKAINDNTFYTRSGGQSIVDSAQSNYSINDENINAAYVNLNKTHKKLSVQAGLRVEQTISQGKLRNGQSVNQNYIQLFPSLFFDYALNDKHTFNIKLSRRTERADYAEMVPFRRPQTPTLFFQGNPNLKPQISWHNEVSWSYKNSFSIAFGYDINRDYIRTLPFLDSNKTTITRMPTNIQGAHSWNIDIGFSKTLAHLWSTDNSVSLYRNTFNGQANGFSLNNSGLPSIYLSTNNSFLITDKLSAECNFEYNSKRQLVTSTFGAYCLLSFGVKRFLLKKKSYIVINANNVLQTEGHNAIDRYSGLYQYSNWHFFTRSVSINFTYRFGKGKTTKAHISSGSEDEQKRAGN
jgi:hypothetical protein